MERELYDKTLKLLKDGVEIQGSFYSNHGRIIEFDTRDEVLNNELSNWFDKYEDWLHEVENYSSDSGEIILKVQDDSIYCKIHAVILDEYFEKHTKDELQTTKFLDIISQQTSKTIDDLTNDTDFEFDITYESSKKEFKTLHIYINEDEDALSLNKEHFNQLKEEFISVFEKWDDYYQGEDYDEMKKYIDCTHDHYEFSVTEHVTIEREVELNESRYN